MIASQNFQHGHVSLHVAYAIKTNIETWMVDERLTTREAREELGFYQEQGRAKKLSADSFAAALLIQSWYRNPVGLTL